MEATAGLEPVKKRTGGRNAPGGPPGNKKAIKHGLYSYRAMLNGDGLDERTSLFKALREKEQELKALGGDPSPQELAIIGDSVKNMLYIASLDNYLMGLKSLVRKGRPHPVLAIHTQLSAHLRENLKTSTLRSLWSGAITMLTVWSTSSVARLMIHGSSSSVSCHAGGTTRIAATWVSRTKA